MTARNSKQQVLTKEPGIVSTVYVKSSFDSDSTRQTVDIINAMPGVVSVMPSNDNLPLITVRFDTQQIRGNHIVQSLRKAGYQRSCIALMYFKGGIGSDFQRDVTHTVLTQAGVIAAERSAHKAYVLIVHFDPRQTLGSRIVAELSKQGYSAMLVGC